MTPILVLLLVLVALLAAASLWLWLRLQATERRLQAQIAELSRSLATRLHNEGISAATHERQRLLADLHDDIGGKLLTLVHTLEQPEQADLVRAVIQDFRDVVSRSHLDACTLLEALGQIREETGQRLDALHGALDWQQHADLPDPPLNEEQVLHLFRIAREAITNALRHGHATQIRVRIVELQGRLIFDVTDNGPGLLGTASPGRGTASMRNRAQELAGRIDWTAGTLGGTKVVLEFPLPGRTEAAAEMRALPWRRVAAKIHTR